MTKSAIEEVMDSIAGQDIVEKVSTADSEVARFYSASTVFVTGGTGFVGKLLIEKLLRTCPDIRKLYILIRERKGKEPSKRLEELFEVPIFDALKRQEWNLARKIGILTGDCSKPDLGLGEEDKRILLTEVDVVFHCAATVRFQDPLKTTALINVRATRDLVKMAKQMKQLKAFIYVSTAYSNPFRKDIDEKIYPPQITGDKLLTLCDTLDDETLAQITPTLLGKHPNTYTYTKAIAEEVVDSHGQGLPIAIVRPSIIISTAREPVCGWIDNMYGLTGVIMGGALGVIRSMRGCPPKVADLVPADYVVSAIVATAWEVGTKTNPCRNDPQVDSKEEHCTPVYNYVSGPQNPITWAQNEQYVYKYGLQIPTPLQVWYPLFKMRPNRYMHYLAVFFLQRVPAQVLDVILASVGRKPMLVAGYKKIETFTDVIGYFAMREWKFKNDNTQALWKRLNERDRDLYDFNMAGLVWDEFYSTYLKGCRTYLLKDTMDTIPAGRVKFRRLKIAHYTLVAVICVLLYKLLSFIFSVLLGFVL